MSVDELRTTFTGSILVDGDDGFASFPFAVGAPGAVLRPHTEADVAAALRHAVANHLSVSIRSGGHTAGSYTSVPNGLVLDMSAFNDIVVSSTTVTVGAGATWGAVAAALAPHHLALTSGDTTSVGVGGLTLGGGVGWLIRKYGLALDNLLSARIVTAAGELVVASEVENPDLFWAIRGGGGNFGVVTEFTFQAQPLEGVVHGVVTFVADDLGGLLRGYREVMRAAPEEFNVTFLQLPPMQPGMPSSRALQVLWAGTDVEAAMSHIQPLLDLPGVQSHDIALKAYVDVLDDPHPPEPGAPMPSMVLNNGWAPELSDGAIDALVAAEASIGDPMVMIRYLRGAFNRVAVTDTAFAWRDAEALVILVAFLPPGTADESEIVQSSWQSVARFTEGTYGNFHMDAGERVVALMYPPETHARLASVKKTWDPTNLFNQNQNVAPAPV